jgi:hypothetical protein
VERLFTIICKDRIGKGITGDIQSATRARL